MPYFAHFKPYDYPIMQFPGFYNALFDIFPNKNHAKLRWKNAVRKIIHRASAQLSPSHPSTSNYRFFIGFSFWMSRAKPDPQKSLPKSNGLLRMLVRILVLDYRMR